MKSNIAVAALAALAQTSRLAVYRLLVQQGPSGLAAGEIAAQLKITPATLSFHLKELTRARIVKSRQDGRFIFYSADFAAMNNLLAYLAENCCAVDGATGECIPTSACATAPVGRTPAAARRARSNRKLMS
jgi:DNA-binding transcriptional ArsR family regulator